MDNIELRTELLRRTEYDAENGVLRRRAGFTGVKAGSPLGTPASGGRIQATFLGKRRQLAHLIWLIETGELPRGVLAHVDGDTSNCRFSNLEDISRAEAGARAPHAVEARVRKAVKYWKPRRPSQAASREERNRRGRERRKAQGDKRREIVRRSCRKHHAANKADPNYRAGKACRAMVHRTIRCLHASKENGTEAVLGYTVEAFRVHIESQFTEGMNWGNHGEWHVDHVKPVAAFLAEGVTDLRTINALHNLQPLPAGENLRKGKRVLC